MKRTLFSFTFLVIQSTGMSILIVLINAVLAHGKEDFSKAEELIKNRVSCSQITSHALNKENIQGVTK